MYTNISNVIDSLMAMVELNRIAIDGTIGEYEPGRRLNVYKGMRKTLPNSAFPSLEFEPSSGSTSWNTNITQMAEYTVQCTLTMLTDNQEMGVEYMGTLTRILLELMNNPMNMSLVIPNEFRYIPNSGMVTTIISDAMVSGVTYNSTKDGTIRVSQWDWTCKIMEGFDRTNYNNQPTQETVLLPHPLPPPPVTE